MRRCGPGRVGLAIVALAAAAGVAAPTAADAQGLTPATDPDVRLVATAPAAAQGNRQEPDRPPAIVRHGKWAAAGLFAGSIALAVVQHSAANDALDDLRVFCRTGSCVIGPDGRYADVDAEALYQRVVSGDRAARVWLIAGQAAFVGTAALFIIDLKGRRGRTNIPFQGLVVTPGRLGIRLPLPR